MDRDLNRKQLIASVKGGQAFHDLSQFIEDIPFEKLGVRPFELPYSFYEQFFHIVFTQKDILDFIEAETYSLPDWPDEYWPNKKKPDSEEEWKDLINQYFNDRQKLIDWIENEDNELDKPVKHGETQTLLREILLVIEHTAYHTGQLLILKRLLMD